MSDDKPNLEQWVIKYQSEGQAWVAAKLKADQLSEGQKNYLASLINDLEKKAAQSIHEDQRKMSEQKLERLARGSKEFIDYTNRMCLAISDMLSKRVRFDAMEKWWESKRSGMSFEKEIVKRGIFTQGG